MQWSELVLVAQLSVGLLFLFSGLTKLATPKSFVASLREYRILPQVIVHSVAALVIGGELLIAASHISGYYLNIMVPIAIGMLVVFLIAVLIVIERGDLVPCQCFGSVDGEYVSSESVIRILVLIFFETMIWLVSDSNPEHSILNGLDLTECLFVSSTAVLTLIAFYWGFKLPRLYSLHRPHKISRQCLQKWKERGI